MRTFAEFMQFLIEDRLDTLKEKYSNLSTDHDPYAEHKGPDIVKHFADKADPSPNKEHTQWILNQYKKGNIRQEDHPRIHETISNFRKYKPKLAQKDLNGYKHISDIEDALKPHIGTISSEREKTRDIKSKGAEKIHDENGVKVHKLKTKEAACAYGKGTKWCTAARENNMFNSYNERGPLYHVHAKDKDGKPAKYQFHHETKSYMDAEDKPVDLHKLTHDNPELRNVKEWQGKHPALTNDHNFDKHFSELLNKHGKSAIEDMRVKSGHLHKALEHPDARVRMAVVKHPNADETHLDKALQDKNFEVRANAIYHPRTTEKHIEKALSDKDADIRSIAASHPKANIENIHKALSDKDEDVRTSALRNNNATTEHIEKGIHDHSWQVREAAAKHKNVTPEQLHKLSDDPDIDVANAARYRLGLHINLNNYK